MEEIAQNILEHMNKLSFDDMDNYDKFEYFRDHIEDDINFLCSQIIEKEPTVITPSEINNDTNNIEKQIISEYDKGAVAMWDILASLGVNNISLEKATELYAKLMNYSDGDIIVRFISEINKDDLNKVGDHIII